MFQQNAHFWSKWKKLQVGSLRHHMELSHFFCYQAKQQVCVFSTVREYLKTWIAQLVSITNPRFDIDLVHLVTNACRLSNKYTTQFIVFPIVTVRKSKSLQWTSRKAEVSEYSPWEFAASHLYQPLSSLRTSFKERSPFWRYFEVHNPKNTWISALNPIWVILIGRSRNVQAYCMVFGWELAWQCQKMLDPSVTVLFFGT